MTSPPDQPFTFVIPAAGAGTRFGAGVPKQYVDVDGVPIVVLTLRRCLALPGVDRVIVAVALDQRTSFEQLLADHHIDRVEAVIGGESRQESVLNALIHLDLPDDAYVAVHDAVRPFFSPQLFSQLATAAIESGASVPLLPLSDTLHRHRNGVVAETPDRAQWGLAQTPQCFRFGVLYSAMKRARDEHVAGTDEAGLVSRYGHTVRVVRGESGNFKITHPNDLGRAEAVLRSRDESHA